MVQTTLKEIRQTNAIDITDVKDGNKVYDEIMPLRIMAYSIGVYGRTGLLLYSDKTKKFYKITRRTSNLYIRLNLKVTR